MICETSRYQATFLLGKNVVSFKNASVKEATLKQ